MVKLAYLLTSLLAAGALSASAETPSAKFRVIKSIDGPDSRWDLLSVDASRHRLYMARVGGVSSIDLLTDKVIPGLVSAKVMHGVTPVGATSVVAASSADDDSIVFFDGVSGSVLNKTRVGKEPDTVVYDPATNTVVSVNAHDLTIMSAESRQVLATVLLAGDPEFAVVDGKGFLYDNIRDRHEIAVVDLRKRAVVNHFPLSQCQEPTGLAYDPPSSLLIAACGSGMTKFVSAAGGQEIASIKIGEGADAVVLDAARRLIFIPSGHSGTLSIISLSNPTAPRLVQTISTKVGTRTGALDPSTGRLYLPSADFAPGKPGEWPRVVPGTMKFLVIAAP